jgi:hypothetical protein
MLAVLLGASRYPNAPQLAAGRAFYLSASDIEEYLCDERGLAIPPQNLCSLFDDARSPTEQLIEITNFLQHRTRDLKAGGSPAQDLLIYYVGHGMFTRGDQAYCLAIRCTNEINEGITSIRASELAEGDQGVRPLSSEVFDPRLLLRSHDLQGTPGRCAHRGAHTNCERTSQAWHCDIVFF